MSDYYHKKVLRYPFSSKDFGVDDDFDIEMLEMHEKYRNLFKNNGEPHFQIAPTEDIFIDFVLVDEFGVPANEYGKSRDLSEKEKQKYLSIFQQLIPQVDMNKVKLVEFCWYNCCEAPSYYDKDDDFYDEI